MQAKGHHKGNRLLSNFGTKIFHSSGDADTAEYASGLLGDRREVFVSPSGGGQVDPMDRIMGTRNASFSMSEQYQAVLRPVVFFGLKRGGRANKYIVEGIVIKSGEAFDSGENYLLVEFKQK